MTTTDSNLQFTCYSNDITEERGKQEQAAASDDPNATLRNRIARAGATKKAIMLVVADERGNDEIAKELFENLGLPKGTKVSTLLNVKPSRRPSVSKVAVSLNLVTQAQRDAVLAPKPPQAKTSTTVAVSA